jgi:hypothetical protein
MYVVMYMAKEEPAVRTQIYLSAEQRKRLDARAKREGKSMAQLIRDAVDKFIAADDVDYVMRKTFGMAPDFEVPPRSEWDREL